jgi:hypothetical protein
MPARRRIEHLKFSEKVMKIAGIRSVGTRRTAGPAGQVRISRVLSL